MRPVSTYHFIHAGIVCAVTAPRWFDARRRAARMLGCAEQDVASEGVESSWLASALLWREFAMRYHCKHAELLIPESHSHEFGRGAVEAPRSGT